MQVLQSKFGRARRGLRDGVALAADNVSFGGAVCSQFVMSCSCQRVLDDQSCVAEQFHRVEDGGSADLKLAVLFHQLHKTVDGKDTIGQPGNTKNLVSFGSLAHGFIYHVLRQSVTQWCEGLLLLVHNQGAKVQLFNSKIKINKFKIQYVSKL